MPCARFMLSRPAASAAPVEPPETSASARPSATAWAARTIDASFVERAAAAGPGTLAIETGASTISTRPGGASMSPNILAGPKRMERTPWRAAMAAPAATSAGPRSAPLASTATTTAPCEAIGLAVVVAVVLGRQDLTAAVVAAVLADPVRAARVVARRARVDRGRRDLVLRTTLGRAAVGLLLLRDGHERRRRVADRGRHRPAGPPVVVDCGAVVPSPPASSSTPMAVARPMTPADVPAAAQVGRDALGALYPVEF